MSTKSITITDDAYERLTKFKESKDSFSDVIIKLTGKYSVLDLVGILSSKEADEMKISLEDIRRRLRKRLDKTAIKLK